MTIHGNWWFIHNLSIAEGGQTDGLELCDHISISITECWWNSEGRADQCLSQHRFSYSHFYIHMAYPAASLTYIYQYRYLEVPQSQIQHIWDRFFSSCQEVKSWQFKHQNKGTKLTIFLMVWHTVAYQRFWDNWFCFRWIDRLANQHFIFLGPASCGI